MTGELTFTGERYVPGTRGEIAHEHWHRYAFARDLVARRRVLDVACGEGYGAALLAQVATDVAGVDIDASTLDHARSRYARIANLSFLHGSAARLPIADASIDAVVSFETIEHLPQADQAPMLDEFARVLAAGGFVVLSSPNRPEYSEGRGYVNPFHVHELDREELHTLVSARFPAQRWYRQRRYIGSALWSEQAGDGSRMLEGDAASVREARAPEAMYFVVVAARRAAELPAALPRLSLFTDADDAEWARIDHEAREVLRLDELLKTRDDELEQQGVQFHELEALARERLRLLDECKANASRLAAQREALDAERTRLSREIETLDGERMRLSREIEAQERIIAYRGSLRWWALLPLLRMRRLWTT
jgi:SAM-dependent methyltransferase